MQVFFILFLGLGVGGGLCGFFLGWVDFSLKMWCWVGYDDDGL